MLEYLLKKCHDEELLTSADCEDVKTAVLSKVEKENNMKHFKIKPLIIAAVAVVAAAVSIITVNAARNDGLTVKEPTKQDMCMKKVKYIILINLIMKTRNRIPLPPLMTFQPRV